jgi:hypothetical protein
VPRNITFQPLRGTQANLRSAMPLSLGEMYFAFDTGALFLGTPGFGVGYVQIGDAGQMNETLQAVLNELKAMRLALVALACDGGRNTPEDFNPEKLASDPEIGKQA